jgi:hypothetical protein
VPAPVAPPPQQQCNYLACTRIGHGAGRAEPHLRTCYTEGCTLTFHHTCAIAAGCEEDARALCAVCFGAPAAPELAPMPAGAPMPADAPMADAPMADAPMADAPMAGAPAVDEDEDDFDPFELL